MKESLLHFIWQYQLFKRADLKTTSGESLDILEVGKLNSDGGPDFLQAKIKINDLIFVGNIEIHIHASDYTKHKHHLDTKYDTLILHVVYFNDDTKLGIPTLELNGRIPYLLFSKYEQLQMNTSKLLCKNMIHEFDPFLLYGAKESLVFERLERKANAIIDAFHQTNKDWEMVCYQLLGKYFGAHLNKEVFELITKRLDYKILLKHQEHPMQLEALLFGVAGFLNKDFVDDYPRKLKKEFQFLKEKYGLNSLPEYRWQFSKMRPISFPTIRLYFFSQMVLEFPLFQKIMEAENLDALFNHQKQSTYWDSHFVMDKLAHYQPKLMGEEFVNSIKINVFAPLLYAYGRYYAEERYVDKSLALLNAVSAETNAKTKIFPDEIFSIETAFDSQAVLELYDNYCQPKKCLQCKIGNKLLRTSCLSCMEEEAIYI